MAGFKRPLTLLGRQLGLFEVTTQREDRLIFLVSAKSVQSLLAFRQAKIVDTLTLI